MLSCPMGGKKAASVIRMLLLYVSQLDGQPHEAEKGIERPAITSRWLIMPATRRS
jgi:hypothetical protein